MFARFSLWHALLVCLLAVASLNAAEPNVLNAKEQVSYTKGLQTLKTDAADGRLIELNLGEQWQYNTLVSHLKLRGKTPANAPQLFRFLKAERVRALKAGEIFGYKTAYVTKSEEDAPQPMHLVEAAFTHDNETAFNASASYPTGTTYTYLDVAYTSSDPNETDVPAMVEEFGGGTDVVAAGTFQPTAESAAKADTVRSINSWSISARDLNGNGSIEENEYLNVTFLSRPLLNFGGLFGLNVDEPVDHTNDGQISICMNRTWTNDCDVNLTGSPNALKVPLKGSYRTPPGYLIDPTGVDAKSKTADPQDFVKLQLTQHGGACEPQYNFSMTDFWNKVSISADRRTISWDYTGANAVDFARGCRQVQDRVEFHVNLRVPVTRFGSPEYLPIFMTTRNLKFITWNFAQLAPMKITNSCLAAGTLIQLNDGSEVAVEDITAGDLVFNEYRKKQAAPVVDTAVGFEDKPMVRIESESGRALMMTDLHPVVTVKNGVTLARDLQVGDAVPTIDGVEKLTSVTRVAYDGNVYNLKLAQRPGKNLASDNTVYANGFMVGDGTMQAHYEKLDRQRSGNILERIPAAWHDDYRNSQR
ncbi:Hint domain-containing protein [Acanthopleuribacter pedis]|uniref:Hint domain-containing protein n=1 Tax=Acanthopleuribacter pedis TaxID=442870 RepID=A0A8J7U3J9_9BACT|nr:Hint domain-containing protein [Acanthopleuribacter pedis]MBO1317331.1 hypothetical protein [Acanthopleuribacter pedis]MBO1318638.1 hypothetical protein [Acanthopleuribacter pedis]